MKLWLPIVAASLAAMTIPATGQAQDSWADRISMNGDFRLRYESISADGSPDRDRSRLRARFGITAEASDDVKLVFRLATGDGSPVSTNLTMDGGFSAKDILVDRAYVDWKVNDNWRLHAGKIKSPWFKAGGTPLVWDGDLNPEGVAAHFSSGPFFGSLAALSVEERSTVDDSLLFTAQGGWKTEVGEGNTLTTGVSYYGYTEAQGNTPFYDGDAGGNRLDTTGGYLNGFNIVEVFGEYKTRVNELPLTIYADIVQNTDADDEDSAWTIGAKVGKAGNPGDWEFGYAFQDTEADAVVATFNDSDFAGGNTDASGHVIKAKYALRENVKLGGTLIVAERFESLGIDQGYDRIQIDLEFSFD